MEGVQVVPLSSWRYASAGAIADTNAVALAAAGGAGVYNYLSAIQLSNTDATVGTIVQVLDGATVLWQFYLAPQIAATAGQNGVAVVFPVPLKGSANTALNVKCVTTSAEVYANAQGFTSNA